jgi:hypothetical protein
MQKITLLINVIIKPVRRFVQLPPPPPITCNNIGYLAFFAPTKSGIDFYNLAGIGINASQVISFD